MASIFYNVIVDGRNGKGEVTQPSGAGIPAVVSAGDRIVSVIDLTNGTNITKNGFDTLAHSGEIYQMLGNDQTGVKFLLTFEHETQ